jgi:hypothetical protein
VGASIVSRNTLELRVRSDGGKDGFVPAVPHFFFLCESALAPLR